MDLDALYCFAELGGDLADFEDRFIGCFGSEAELAAYLAEALYGDPRLGSYLPGSWFGATVSVGRYWFWAK